MLARKADRQRQTSNFYGRFNAEVACVHSAILASAWNQSHSLSIRIASSRRESFTDSGTGGRRLEIRKHERHLALLLTSLRNEAKAFHTSWGYVLDDVVARVWVEAVGEKGVSLRLYDSSIKYPTNSTAYLRQPAQFNPRNRIAQVVPRHSNLCPSLQSSNHEIQALVGTQVKGDGEKICTGKEPPLKYYPYRHCLIYPTTRE